MVLEGVEKDGPVSVKEALTDSSVDIDEDNHKGLAHLSLVWLKVTVSTSRNPALLTIRIWSKIGQQPDWSSTKQVASLYMLFTSKEAAIKKSSGIRKLILATVGALMEMEINMELISFCAFLMGVLFNMHGKI